MNLQQILKELLLSFGAANNGLFELIDQVPEKELEYHKETNQWTLRQQSSLRKLIKLFYDHAHTEPILLQMPNKPNNKDSNGVRLPNNYQIVAWKTQYQRATNESRRRNER